MSFIILVSVVSDKYYIRIWIHDAHSQIKMITLCWLQIGKHEDFFKEGLKIRWTLCQNQEKKEKVHNLENCKTNFNDIHFSPAEWMFFRIWYCKCSTKESRNFTCENTLDWNATKILALKFIKSKEGMLLLGLQKTVDTTDYFFFVAICLGWWYDLLWSHNWLL